MNVLTVHNDIDSDICHSEEDIHTLIDKDFINDIIENLGINRFTFFKPTKKLTKDDIENFNIILEACYATKRISMTDSFLALCSQFIDVEKAKKILTQNNLFIIKKELQSKHCLRIKKSAVNTLTKFFN
jgi:hypothetical protein